MQILPAGGTFASNLGANIGRGLSEQVPKEVERYRLSRGLQDLANQSGNLDPVQTLARVASIPGITPQMIQSFGELSRLQQQKGAFGRLSGGGDQRGLISQQAGLNQQGQEPGSFQERIASALNPQQAESTTRPSQARSEPGSQATDQIVNEPELNERALTRSKWDKEKRNQRINEYINDGFLPDQAKELAKDDEDRDLSEPGFLQQRQAELQGKREQARGEFSRQLGIKLEKEVDNEGKPTDVYRDITGENLANIQKEMERDLRLNPNLTFAQAADKWSTKALEFAKTKIQLKTLLKTTGNEAFIKGNEDFKKLQSFSDIFKDANNSEEFYNLLQEDGLKLSPQGAASIAFKPSSTVEKIIKNYGIENKKIRESFKGIDREQNARKLATQVAENMTHQDSPLSIAWNLSKMDPSFDQKSFFDQLSQESENTGFTDRQRRETAQGVPGLIPHWGDILIFPLFGGKK